MMKSMNKYPISNDQIHRHQIHRHGFLTVADTVSVAPRAGATPAHAVGAEGGCWRPAVAATLAASEPIPMSPTPAVLATRCMRHSGKKSRAFYADALSCESEVEERRRAASCGRGASAPRSLIQLGRVERPGLRTSSVYRLPTFTVTRNSPLLSGR